MKSFSKRPFTSAFMAGLFLVPTSVVGQSIITIGTGENLNEALKDAQRLRLQKPNEPVVIELRGGTHFLEAPLIILPSDKDRQLAPLEIRGAKNASVTLSGGRPLGRLKWKKWKGKIWRAKVRGASFDMLWDGDSRLIRARYPNFDPAQKPFGGVAADATSPERVKGWTDPTGGVIHAMHSAQWGALQVPINGKTSDGKLILGEPKGNNRTVNMGPSEDQRFVDNIFEELDAPGEWYHDKKTGWLYFIPRDGEKFAAGNFIASRYDNIIEVRGTAAAPVKDVSISNIHFKHSAPTFLKATEPLLRSDWLFSRTGAILIDGGQKITVQKNDFSELGGNAVVFSGYGRSNTVTGNAISNIGGTAVAFVGSPTAVRSPLFEYHESLPLDEIDRTPGPKTQDYQADSSAADNLIHDIGQIDKQAAGVEISMAARITVDHNSIYRVPRAGINVSEGTWGGHIITNNDVFETVLETGDHGAFNSWGRDRFWYPDREEMGRRTAQERSLVSLDAMEPTIIQRNRFHCDHGWDIDLDDGSSNYIIEDNLMLAGGLKFREGFDRVARNNIMINNSFHPHVWFENSGDVFEHNIVTTGYQPILMKHWGKKIDYNVFPNDNALQRAQALGTDQHSVAGNIDFVDPDSGNFNVAPQSSALSVGFKNFSMENFGVTSERLKAVAEKPRTPKLVAADSAVPDQVYEALGMTFKSVTTLGEQSAAGLAKREGVLILSVSPDGSAAKAGLKTGDVILRVVDEDYGQSDPTPTADEFEGAYRGRKWRGEIVVEISRNQSRQQIKLSTR